MTTKTIDGCSYSEFWVHPPNWQKATKKDLEKDWYVQCAFFDPRFQKKYPKGFPYRKRVNKPKTIEERKAVVSFLLKKLPEQLNDGFNPILKKYVSFQNDELHPDLYFIDAFRLSLSRKKCSFNHAKNIRCAINRIEKSSESLFYQTIKIKDLKRVHLKKMLDHLRLTDYYYNKFVKYISALYRELIEYECCESNITRDIYPKKVIKAPRLILEKSELEIVKEYLKENHPNFFRYMMIFLYSGARSTELFRLQKKNVDVEQQEFTIFLEKGSQYTPCTKVILTPAVDFWKDIIKECKSDDDYLFGIGFKPNKKPVMSETVTRYWKRHVKNKLGIEADFYALKHYMLDSLDSETAMLLASHTNQNTTAIYQVNKKKKEREQLKKLDIKI